MSADLSAMLSSRLFFIAALCTSEACHSIIMTPMQKMPRNMVELVPESLLNRGYTTTQRTLIDYTTTQTTRFTRWIFPLTSTTKPFSTSLSSTTTRQLTTSTTTPHSTTTTSHEKPSTKRNESSVKWSCLAAMVQIETTHHWNEQLTEYYRSILNQDLMKLEQHSGTTLPSFGSVFRKVASVQTSAGEKFGELFFIEKIQKPCSELKEFVRKAVSWSKDIPRAVVACGCEVPVEIYKF